ncbi:hypothetical protein [uncultured Clostridium sp.]|uniref:hypothetical protein n=1 Tax=uncultured Clostridium sp. TaxID=59620 RepID=UPI00262AB421|nr:hypothetical protein [uncultured Clostridium sp.]
MVKKRLGRYRGLLAEIELLKRQLNKIEPEFVRDSVSGSTLEYPYINCKVHIEGYDLESYKRKVQRMNKRIIKKMNELVEEKDKLIELIYSIEDSEARQIFIYKYIDGLTWNDIGNKMNYGVTSIRNKHREYINKLKCDTK